MKRKDKAKLHFQQSAPKLNLPVAERLAQSKRKEEDRKALAEQFKKKK